jgi:hypothetical protein
MQDKTEVLRKLDRRIWHGTLDKVSRRTAKFTDSLPLAAQMGCPDIHALP